ncbi:MAG TPA: hypothetical protein V6D25_26595 [Leptolyngbyaceae cyanobacterium]
MPQPDLYRLRFLFSNQQITLNELKQETQHVLQKYITHIIFSINPDDNGFLVLEIEGNLDIVDACHDKINDKLLNKRQLKFIRQLDEAGDEIRRQAYPILAEIEQRFRAFISQALVEVLGFDWWSSFAPPEIRKSVESVREKHQSNDLSLDPLEFTQFDDLIKIITAKVSGWSEDKQLSVKDVLEIISGCNSVSEITTKLTRKIEKVHFWDIFSNFFYSEESWKEFQKSLNVVIKQRHKVMHHRPIRLGVLKLLNDKKAEILAMLDSTKTKLSENEILETKEEVKEYFEHSDSPLIKELNKTLTKPESEIFKSVLEPRTNTSEMFKSLVEPRLNTSEIFNPLSEALKSMLEPRTNTSEMFKSLMGPRLDTSEMLKSLVEPRLNTSEMLKSLMGPRLNTSKGLPKYL